MAKNDIKMTIDIDSTQAVKKVNEIKEVLDGQILLPLHEVKGIVLRLIIVNGISFLIGLVLGLAL